MDNKRPQAAECTPGKMHKATKYSRNMTDAGFRFLYPLWLKSPLSCPCVRSGSPGGRTAHFQSPHLYSGTSPLGNPISRPFVLNTLLAFTYFPPIPQSYQSPVSPQNSALRVFCQEGTPPELWILFSSLSIEQLEGKDSLFLLLFFLRPQHKASCSSVIQEHLDGSIKTE